MNLDETRIFSVGSTAIMDVMRERTRQINEEGWTPAHDDRHTLGEMATAAYCYIRWGSRLFAPADWPWSIQFWKPSDRRRDLVKAAALIVAEIERLDRAELRKTQEVGQ